MPKNDCFREHGGRARALDNVFVERLWHSVKHEDLYLKANFVFYNTERMYGHLAIRLPTLSMLLQVVVELEL